MTRAFREERLASAWLRARVAFCGANSCRPPLAFNDPSGVGRPGQVL
jgi:hypothetical protein